MFRTFSVSPLCKAGCNGMLLPAVKRRLLSYVQGQYSGKVRQYFYYIDHEGQLFLDDARMKNFTSCFKGIALVPTASRFGAFSLKNTWKMHYFIVNFRPELSIIRSFGKRTVPLQTFASSTSSTHACDTTKPKNSAPTSPTSVCADRSITLCAATTGRWSTPSWTRSGCCGRWAAPVGPSHSR